MLAVLRCCLIMMMINICSSAPGCLINFCMNCLTMTTCSSCISGYGLMNPGSCKICDILIYPNCLTCTSSKCLSCDTSLGYFLNAADCNFINNQANRTCVICNLYKCVACNDGPVCTSCVYGYYLEATSGFCLHCLYPCEGCATSATNCIDCVSDSAIFFDGISACVSCSSSLSYCSTCDSLGTICITCVSTYYYIDTGACLACNPPCLQCSSAIACLSCTDTTTSYQVGSNLCQLCSYYMVDCIQCLSATVCITCSTASTLYLTYPPNQCATCITIHPQCVTCQQQPLGPVCILCNPKFYIDNIFCVDCPYQCATCTDAITCTGCVAPSYLLVGTNCQVCNSVIPNCEQCTDGTPQICTVCVNNTIPDAASGLCIQCTSLQYTDIVNQICTNCVSPCYQCLSATACTSCVQYFTYQPNLNSCADTCGDLVVMTAQCDNGYGVANDGCSDKCVQQTDYTCALTATTINTTSAFLSICSYNIPMLISISQIKRQAFTNVATFTYSLVPYLYGLPGTTLQQFTQSQLQLIFILTQTPQAVAATTSPNILVSLVAVDSANSQVSITFTHSSDVKNSKFTLYVNITYLRNDLGVVNFLTTPDAQMDFVISNVRPTTMVGLYHTDQDYSTAKSTAYLVGFIAIASFLLFIIGIFTKQIVGLQMSMLCQFVYLNLFFFKGPLDLSFYSLSYLIYSNGFNLQVRQHFPMSIFLGNPPQQDSLTFDSTTLSNNFNVMTLFYVLPLLTVLPFIPLKAKCIRKISIVQFGHKWVDLLLGQIYLALTLFNYQYFLFCLIQYYMDKRNIQNYFSTMIVAIGGMSTIATFVSLVIKPQIFGNFRTSFSFNHMVTYQQQQKNQALKGYQQTMMNKFQSSKCNVFGQLLQKLQLFINQNYFWRKYRRLHTLFTYNHYNVIILFFTITTLCITLMDQGQIVVLVICGILLVDLIVMRPYGQIIQKVRAIFFMLIFLYTSFIRYLSNQNAGDTSNNKFCVTSLVFLLLIALIWTFIQLISYFVAFVKLAASDRNQLISKVFNEQQQHKKQTSFDEQDALMRKLMKRFQRIQLQYNFNDARNQLLTSFDPSQQPNVQNGQQAQLKEGNNQGLKNPLKKQMSLMIPSQILKSMQQQKNYKNMKQYIQKQKRKLKREEKKKKISGQKMLKLLNLDNFSKYQDGFKSPKNQKFKKTQQQVSKQLKQQQQQQYNILQNNQQEALVNKVQQEIIQQSEVVQLDYVSVQPQTLQEAQKKIDQEKILIQENQHIRYKRAVEVISKHGLNLDMRLIEENYDKI